MINARIPSGRAVFRRTLLYVSLWVFLSANPGFGIPDSFEPNNSHAQVATCALNQEISATLFPVGDQDFYSVPVASGHRGILTVSIEDSPANLNLHVYLFQANQEIGHWERPPGQPFLCQWPILSQGSYTLQICDGLHGVGEEGYSYHWNNQASSQPYRLKVTFEDLSDATEPNNSAETATALPLNTEFSGKIFPAGDQDYFALAIPTGKRGKLTCHVEHMGDMINPVLFLYDASKTEILHVSHPLGEPVLFDCNVASGQYYLALVDGNHGKAEEGYSYHWNNQGSRSIYHGTLKFQEVPDSFEPNDDLARAATITLAVPVNVALFPLGDTDFFSFTLPPDANGRILIEADFHESMIAPFMRLVNKGNETLREVRGKESNLCQLAYHVKSGGTFFLEIQDGHHGSWEPGYSYDYRNRTGHYQFKVLFEPVTDPLGRHDTPETASPIDEGKEYSSILFPEGDQDFFRIAITGTTGKVPIQVEIPDIRFPIQPTLVLLNAEKNEISRASVSFKQPLSARFTLDASATYYLQIFDDNRGFHEPGYSYDRNNQASPQPYHIRWQRLASLPPSSAPPPPSDHAVATAAQMLAVKTVPASTPFFLAPGNDSEWFDLGTIGPGQLECRIVSDNPDWRLKTQLIEVPASGSAKTVGTWQEGNPSAWWFRHDLSQPGHYQLRVQDESGASSAVALSLETTLHPAPVKATDAVSVDLGQPARVTLFPANATQTFEVNVPQKGLLTLRVQTPHGLGNLTKIFHRPETTRRVLYLVGGRADYNAFSPPAAGIDVQRFTWNSPEFLRLFRHVGRHQHYDWPTPSGATFSALIPTPPPCTYRRLLMRAYGFSREAVSLKLNDQPLSPVILEDTNGWQKVAYPLPEKVSDSGPLQLFMDSGDHSFLLADVRFEGWAGTQTVSLPVPPFADNPLPESFLQGYDDLIMDGVNSPMQFFFDMPQVRERFVRFASEGGRFLILGSQYFSYSAIHAGSGAQVATASAFSVQDARVLHDGNFDPAGASTILRTAAPLPQSYVIALPGSFPVLLDHGVLHLASPYQSGADQIRDFRIEVSMEASDKGFVEAGSFSCPQALRFFRFSFPAKPARFVRFTAVTNHGFRDTHFGDLELYGPQTPDSFFGVSLQSTWVNERVQPVSEQEPLFTEFATGNPNGWPYSETCGSWVGGREAGFTPAFVDTLAPDVLAVTLKKRLGKGWLILDSQEVSYSGNIPFSQWKIFNLLGYPPLRLMEFSTLGGVDLTEPGKFHVQIRADHPEKSSLDPGSLLVQLQPATSTAEPNETLTTASAIGSSVADPLFPAGDVDYWRFEVLEPAKILPVLLNPTTWITSTITIFRQSAPDKSLTNIHNSFNENLGWSEAGSFLATEPGLYAARIQSPMPNNRTNTPYTLLLDHRPINVCFEDNKNPDSAVKLEAGKPLEAGIFPGTDQDWFYVEKASGPLDLYLASVPEDLDPQIKVFRPSPFKDGTIRILYLVGNPDSHDLDKRLPPGFHVERVQADQPEAKTALARLSQFDAVIIDRITSPEQFSLFNAESQKQIQEYVRNGGHVLITAMTVSFNELLASRGGTVVSCRGQWSDAWTPKNLIRGGSTLGNDNPFHGWCAAQGGATFPQDIVFAFPPNQEKVIDRVIIHNTAQQAGRRIKEFRLFSSNQTGTESLQLIGSFTAQSDDAPQTFSFTSRAMKLLKIAIDSSYGDGGEIQFGQFEALGPDTAQTLFGLTPVYQYSLNQVVEATPPNPQSRKYATGDVNNQPWHNALGWFDGWKDAGFEPLYFQAPGSTTRAITLFKRIGTGTLALDAQNIGGSAQNLLWKIYNLLDFQPTYLQTINGTSWGGNGYPERAQLLLPAGKFFLQVSAVDQYGSLGTYRLKADFPAGPAETPLRIIGFSPHDEATGISPNSPIKISFNHPVSESSLKTSLIRLTGEKSGPISWHPEFDSLQNGLRIVPDSPFPSEDSIALECAPGCITDRFNHPSETNASITFQIGKTSRHVGGLVLSLTEEGPFGPGSHPFTVTSPFPLPQPPEAVLLWPGKEKVKLPLTPAGNQSWQGTVEVTSTSMEGRGTLSVEGKDSRGEPVNLRGAPLPIFVDRTPPAAPLAPPQATPGVGGRIDLLWGPAPGKEGIGSILLFRRPSGTSEWKEISRIPRPETTSTMDTPPSEGVWEFAYSWVDRAGNIGRQSAPVRVTNDATPPGQAPESFAASVVDRQIRFTWSPVADGTVGYNLYRSEPEESFSLARSHPIKQLDHRARDTVDQPYDGDYVYRISARDAAGNLGPVSETRVHFDTTIARLGLAFQKVVPISPDTATQTIGNRFPPGQLSFVGTLSEKITMLPLLTIHLADHASYPVLLEQSGDLLIRGTVSLPTSAADGWVSFSGLATDTAGNVGLAVDSPGWWFDTASPTWKIVRNPGVHAVIGTVSVGLIPAEPLSATPTLSFSCGSYSTELSLNIDNNGVWWGSMYLDQRCPDGEGTFAASGLDFFGRQGRRILAGENLFKDGTPPGPPLEISTGGAPGGGIRLHWKPPIEETPSGYHVFRGGSPSFVASSANRIATSITSLEYLDKTATGSDNYYRLVTIDPAGNESDPSEARKGLTDSTPPPPPSDVVQKTLPGGQIQLSWVKPRLEDVARYHVYRQRLDRKGTVSRDTIHDGPQTTVTDFPRQTGEISYEVTALDEAGNESPAITTASFSYDIEPPVVKFTADPSYGRRVIPIYGFMSVSYKDLGEVVRPGPLTVVLAANEPLRDSPKLTMRSTLDEVPQTVPLVKKTPEYFTGTIDLKPGPRNDMDVRFQLEAFDPAGNRNIALAEEAHLLLDSAPPPALNALAAKSEPGGAVRLTWAPPGGEPEGEPVYQILRARNPFSSYSDGQLIASNVKSVEFVDRAPQDGTWYYSVIAMDRAGYIGSFTPVASATVDSLPPPPPATISTKLGKNIAMDWPASSDGASVTWRVYMTSQPPASASELATAKPLAENLSEPLFRFTPQREVKFFLSVVAVDPAGNLSSPAVTPLIDISAKVPAARVRTEPPGPVRSAVRITLESSLPLMELPVLLFRPQDRPIISLKLIPKEGSRTLFLTSMDIDDQTGDGTGHFQFQGKSEAGMPGTQILDGETLVIDTQAPSANITLSPPSPLRPGLASVTLVPSEFLPGVPSLSFVPQGGQPTVIPLASAPGDNGIDKFVGEIPIASGLPDGYAFWRFSGMDKAGNPGTAIAPDRFLIDSHPPKPVTQIKAVSRQHGEIELFWAPPQYTAQEAPETIRGYQVFRSNQAFSSREKATLLETVPGISFVDRRVPNDGLWYYAVVPVDQAGLEGKLSSLASGTSIRTPPSIPGSLKASVLSQGIQLTWSPTSHHPALASDQYEIWCATQDPVSRKEQFSRVWGPGTSTSTLHRPLRGGNLQFRARAIDTLQHVSEFSPPVPVHYERLAPAASLTFSPSLPLSSGTVQVILETTRPLSGVPRLLWKPVLSTGAQETLATSASSTAIVLQGSGKVFRGSFVVPVLPELSAIEFTWDGSSQVNGQAVSGSDFLHEPKIPVDFTLPSGHILFDGNLPTRDRKTILKAGRYPFTLVVNKPLRSVPTLRFESRSGKKTNLLLSAQEPTRYLGQLSTEAQTGDGTGQFFLEAIDLKGGVGTDLSQGGEVLIDTVPPARIGKIRATTYPGGRVRVDWTPPLSSTGRPDASANTFQVFRSTQEILDTQGLSPIQTVSRTLGMFDEPKGSKRYFYSVSPVDDAGNVGPISISAAATVDRDPPAPPRAISATIMDNGVIKTTWDPPEGKKAIFYNVYLEKFPIVSTAGLQPNARGVPFTYLYGTPNEDGRYYFAVTAVDDSMNESQPSETVGIDYRRTLPIASISIDPDIWLKNGMYPVRLETSKPLSEPPDVQVKHEKDLSYPLRFEGSGSRWQASLAITSALPEGTCGFLFRGKGDNHTIGTEISRGPLFHIDRTPPLPPGNLRIAPDETNTPGAVKLSWNSPKRQDQATEVPHFYRIYRSFQTIATLTDLEPIHEMTVEYENLDEYTYHDVPPQDGTWNYVVTAIDMARNESVPSSCQSVLSSTKVPRLQILLFNKAGGDAPVDRLGSGETRIELRSSQPLASATLKWFEVQRSEKLEGKIATRTPILLQQAQNSTSSPSQTLWTGFLAIGKSYSVEQAAEFEASVTGLDGLTSTFIGSGKVFTIDTVGPEARIRIPSINTMRIDAKANKLVVAPVKGGLVDITMETLGELQQPPELFWTMKESQEWHPIPMTGFGTQWQGRMEIPGNIGSATAIFRYRGLDRVGNICTVIEGRKYERKVDESMEVPRTLESYATIGEEFSIDSVPPDPPRNLSLDQKKLGVAVIKWEEGPGVPTSFNLYRSLTPIVSTEGLTAVKTSIFSPVIVDDPPVDGNWFYAVTQLDMAGNESLISESKSVFVDSIKPELRIKAVPSGEDFVILMEEEEPPGTTIELRFPGGKTMEVDMGGSSGQLKEVPVPGGGGRKQRGYVLPQILQQFNGTVEVIVHSPDPSGNRVEQITKIEAKQVTIEAGGEVQSMDNLIKLEIPPGITPVIPKGPGEFQRVGGYQNLFFIRYENIPTTPRPTDASAPVDLREPDPLPPSLEVIGTPYRIELNVNTEKPMELKGSATQADLSGLKALTAKLRMKIPDLGSDSVASTDYLASRLKVVKWVPATKDEAFGKKPLDKRGRWEIVPDIEIGTGTGEIIAPATDVTTYVIVSERTPPSIVDLEPTPDGAVKTFRPEIKARIIDDKGTGVAIGAENPITLQIDGLPIDRSALKISEEDPTEVTVTYQPPQDLSPGTHIITLKAQDVVENQAVRRWKFSIDNEPPKISSAIPADNAQAGVPRPVISALLEDEGGGVDPEKIALSIDGASVSARFDSVTGRLVAYPDHPLSSGKHQVTLLIEDRGGKRATLNWTFSSDSESPRVELSEPAPGSALAAKGSAVVFRLTDQGVGVKPSSILLDIDGQLIGPSILFDVSKTFNFNSVTGRLTYTSRGGFSDGPHHALVSVADKFGRTTMQHLEFSVDSTPPTLSYLTNESIPFRKEGAHLIRIHDTTANPVLQMTYEHLYDPLSRSLLVKNVPTGEPLSILVTDSASHTTTSKLDPNSGQSEETVQRASGSGSSGSRLLMLLIILGLAGGLYYRFGRAKPSLPGKE